MFKTQLYGIINVESSIIFEGIDSFKIFPTLSISGDTYNAKKSFTFFASESEDWIKSLNNLAKKIHYNYQPNYEIKDIDLS